MRKSEHRHYMTSTVWQLRKQRYFETYRRQCVACGTTQGQIDLHHITYARAPGQELDKDLIPLCAWDHAEVHRLERTTERGLRQATLAVTGGQKAWRLNQRAVMKPKKKKHRSDRYRPLVAGFEATDRTKPQSNDVVRSNGNHPKKRRARMKR